MGFHSFFLFLFVFVCLSTSRSALADVCLSVPQGDGPAAGTLLRIIINSKNTLETKLWNFTGFAEKQNKGFSFHIISNLKLSLLILEEVEGEVQRKEK